MVVVAVGGTQRDPTVTAAPKALEVVGQRGILGLHLEIPLLLDASAFREPVRFCPALKKETRATRPASARESNECPVLSRAASTPRLHLHRALAPCGARSRAPVSSRVLTPES